MNCLPENLVGTDTRGRYEDVVGDVDNESVGFEALSYYLRPLDDDRCAKMRKVESAPLAEVTWRNVQDRGLRDREVVAR